MKSIIEVSQYTNLLSNMIGVIGGFAGFLSASYTFIKRNKKLLITLPQERAIVNNMYILENDFDEVKLRDYKKIGHKSAIVADICIINPSSKDQVVHSIKLEKRNKRYDLNRSDFHNSLCFEEYKNVPIDVKSESSVLLKISFLFKDTHIESIDGYKIKIFYLDKQIELDLKDAYVYTEECF